MSRGDFKYFLTAMLIALVSVKPVYADLNKTVVPIISVTATASSRRFLKDIWNSDGVAERIGKLLLRREENEEAFEKSKESGTNPYKTVEWHHTLLAEQDIYHDTTPEGDCAIVQALALLNDGAEAEDVTCQIEKRGKRMLPILKYALAHTLYIGKNIPSIPIIKECQAYIESHSDDSKMSCD